MHGRPRAWFGAWLCTVTMALVIFALAIVEPARAQGAMAAAPSVPASIYETTADAIKDDDPPETPEDGRAPVVLPSNYMFIPVDINKDGVTDWRVDFYRGGDASYGFCGTGGCLQQLYVSDGQGGFTLAFDEQVNYFRIEPGDAQSSLVVVDVYGGYCGGSGVSECQIALRWDAARKLLEPVGSRGTTSAIRTFDPLPNSKRVIPKAVEAQEAQMVQICKKAGFTLSGQTRPTFDFNGDGITDWLVGVEGYCIAPQREEGAEPPSLPDIPATLMISKGSGFDAGPRSPMGGFSVDISTPRPVFVAETGGNCRPGSPEACITTSYVWDSGAGRMVAFSNDPLGADDAALLDRLDGMASAYRWPIGGTADDVAQAKALVERLTIVRAPNDIPLARARYAYGVLALESGDRIVGEENLRRARDAFAFAGDAQRERRSVAQLYMARAIDDPARIDEKTNLLGWTLDGSEEALGLESWPIKRTYELYVATLYRDRNFQIDREKLDLLLASDVGRGPEAWAGRREFDRYASALARSQFRWADALAIDQTTVDRAVAAGAMATLDAGEDYAMLAVDLTSLARFADAEKAARAALAMYEKAYGAADRRTLGAQSDLGEILLRAGKTDEAETILQHVVAAMDGDDVQTHDLPLAYRRLADSALVLGRLSEAGTLLEKARAAEEALNQQYILSQTYDPAATTRALGRLQVLTGHGAAAAATFAKGFVLAGSIKPETVGMLLDYLDYADRFATQEQRDGVAAYAEVAAPDSLSLARKALELAQQVYGDPHPEIARAKRLVARILVEQGGDEALGSLNDALESARALPGDGAVIGQEIRTELAQYLVATRGDLSLALGVAREAVVIARERRARLRAAGGSAVDLSIRHAFITLAGVIAAITELDGKDQTLIDEAFRTLQDAEVSQAGVAIARATLVREARQPAVAKLVTDFNAAEQRSTALDRLYLSALSAGDGEGMRRLQEDVAIARGEAQRLDAQLRAAIPVYGALVEQRPMALSAVRSRLGRNEAIVILSGDEQDIMAMAVSKDGAVLHRAAGYAPVFAQQVDAVRCTVDPGNCSDTLSAALDGRLTAAGWGVDDERLPFDRKAAHAIYDALIAPLEDAFPADATLMLVQHGAIGKLSLAMLPVNDPAGADDFDTTKMAGVIWLIDRHPLLLLPSVAAFGNAGKAKDPATVRSNFVGFGNPALTGRVANARGLGNVFVRGGGGWMAAPTQLARLAPLPGTQRELEAMASVMQAGAGSIVTGSFAREEAVKADGRLAQSRVVAFATHGLLPNELQGLVEPGLVFTPPAKASALDDGILTASEVTALPLNADWVILSACNTASSDGAPGSESLSALARSFLLSGAQSVLASRWSVPDAPTAALTVETLNDFQAADGASRAQALQRGMIAVRTGMRADGSALPGWTADWAHPISWGAFVLISARQQ